MQLTMTSVLRTTLSLTLIAMTLNLSAPARADLFDGPVDRLPVADRVALREGKILLEGTEGQYTARILVDAQVDKAWTVLTDYDNYENFLPNVESSQIIRQEAGRKILEQVNVARAFIFTSKAKFQNALTETPQEQIAFELVQGDVKHLKGAWNLAPVADFPGGPETKTLITYTVSVDPGASFTRGIFFDVFESATQDTLQALKTEIERRST